MTSKQLKICIVAPLYGSGGVPVSTKNIYFMFRDLGFKVKMIPVELLSRINYHINLNDCYVIQVHGPLPIISLMKLIFMRRQIKILKLHGWVIDEAKVYLVNPSVRIAKRIITFAKIIINWLIHRIIFIPYIYDTVTSVSRCTAKKNKVKAIVTPNPLCPHVIDKRISQCKVKVYDKKHNEIVFVTYVSIGGGKILGLPRVIKLVYKLNKMLTLRKIPVKVKLLIFCKDLPENIVKIINKLPYVEFKGYTQDFLCYIKNSDLVILGYTFPELGNVALEAAYLGIPIAKFTNNLEEEEIIDGFSGILAKDDAEMLEKLFNYITNIRDLKKRLGRNLCKYILMTRNINVIAKRWETLIRALGRCSA